MKRKCQLKMFTKQKADPENTLDFRWSDVQEENEEGITKANLILRLQKQADKENFHKNSYWRIVWWL